MVANRAPLQVLRAGAQALAPASGAAARVPRHVLLVRQAAAVVGAGSVLRRSHAFEHASRAFEHAIRRDALTPSRQGAARCMSGAPDAPPGDTPGAGVPMEKFFDVTAANFAQVISDR